MANRIGFFSLQPTPDTKGYIGAILITDNLGKPEEFRVTYPVKPTNLQRLLYGASLVPHIGIELTAKPLWNSIKIRPDILVMDEDQFLPLGKDIECPVVHVDRLGDKLTINTEAQATNQPSKVVSASGRFIPLSAKFPAEYTEEQRGQAMSLLERFFVVLDLPEPFQRIETAVKALASQDEKFR